MEDLGGGVEAVRLSQYQSGMLGHDAVLVDRPGHVGPVGGIFLGFGRQPVYFIRTRRRVTTTPDGRKELAAEVQVYGSDWSLVAEGNRELIADLSPVVKTVERSNALMPNEVSVVDCASEFSERSSLQAGRLLVGPNTSDPLPFVEGRGPSHRGVSLFGWVLTEPGDFYRYFDSRLGLDALEISTHGVTDHMLAVNQVLLNPSPDLRLIPIGEGRCLIDQPRWVPGALDPAIGRARVANLSFFAMLDETSCRELVSLDERLLWIAGAGNTGLELSPGQPRVRCPQSLGPLRNLIVAAGIAGTTCSLWDASDWGVDYADIAANVRSSSGRGTSFASPRVARVAAEIFKTHRPAIEYEEALSPAYGPRHTATLLRLSILLAARIPSPSGQLAPLPVRSGGCLDESRAHAVARVIFTELSADDRRLLASGGMGNPDCLRPIVRHVLERSGLVSVQARVNLLIERGVLSIPVRPKTKKTAKTEKEARRWRGGPYSRL